MKNQMGMVYLVYVDAGPLPEVRHECEKRIFIGCFFPHSLGLAEEMAKPHILKLQKIRELRVLRNCPEQDYPKNFRLVFERGIDEIIEE